MRIALLTALFIGFTGTSQAFAADCGEAPQNPPSVPDGGSSDAEQIRTARDAVIAYSSKVDAYLTCMDGRAPEILPYLTKDQQLRWDQDLADIHDSRRELQTRMNESIRAFRRSTSN